MTRAVNEWIGSSDDARIPPRVRLRIYERDKGCCQKCTRKLFAGEAWEVDHVTALVNRDGGNRESNLQLLCTWCHKQKNAADVAEKSRTNRRKAKNIGIKKPRTITSWRRFDGSIKHASRER